MPQTGRRNPIVLAALLFAFLDVSLWQGLTFFTPTAPASTGVKESSSTHDRMPRKQRRKSHELQLPISSKEVRCTVTKLNKLSVDCAIDGSDLVGNMHVADASTGQRVDNAEDAFSVGQELTARVLCFDANRVRLCAVNDLRRTLARGSEVRGRVTKLNPLSADVAIDESGVTGNAHVADFLEERVDRAEDVWSIDQEISVRVKAVQPNGRYKLTSLDDPALAIPFGKEVRGTVTEIFPSSVHVAISGSDQIGSVHVSDFFKERVDSLDKVLSVGQEMDLRMMGDSRDHKLKLARPDHPFFSILADK